MRDVVDISRAALLPPAKGDLFCEGPFPRIKFPWKGKKHEKEVGLDGGRSDLTRITYRSYGWLERRPFLTVLDPFETNAVKGKRGVWAASTA